MSENRQLLTKGDAGKYRNIYPYSYTETVKDKKTGESLDNILVKTNFLRLQYKSNPSNTRLQVDAKYRRKGLWIQYITDAGSLVVEYYNNTDISDSKWSDNKYWVAYNSAQFNPGTIGIDAISQEAIEYLLSNVYIDSQDITRDSLSRLQFANRAYNPDLFSGKGYIILRQNIFEDTNILRPNMISYPNTIYEIRYDFNLQGNTITIPTGCILKFNGGSLSNGTIIGNDTFIEGDTKIFDLSVKLEGTINRCVLYPKWFGASSDINFDNSEILGYIFRTVQNGYTIDFENNRYYIYNNYIGSTTDDFDINNIARLRDKQNIHIINGIIDIPQHSVGSKCFFPSSLVIDGCKNIVISNMYVSSKGENFGDTDASASMNYEERRLLTATGGGHPIVIIKSKDITVNNSIFEYCGSVASFYVQSSDKIIANNVESYPRSLGYSAFNLDSWCGNYESSTKEHLLILNNCSTNKRDGTYGAKCGVLVEDNPCKIIVNGGIFEDIYSNGNNHEEGNAFKVGDYGFLEANDVYIKQCDYVASTSYNCKLYVNNLHAINISIGANIHTGSNFSKPNCYICYKNCKIDIIGNRLWNDQGSTDRSFIICNTTAEGWCNIDFINCDISGADTFIYNNNTVNGFINVIGGTYNLISRIVDSRGWGTPNPDTPGGIHFKGAYINVNGTDSQKTYSYISNQKFVICYINKANQYVYVDITLDNSTIINLKDHTNCERIDSIGIQGESSIVLNKDLSCRCYNCYVHDTPFKAGYVKPCKFVKYENRGDYWLLYVQPLDRINIEQKNQKYGLQCYNLLTHVESFVTTSTTEDGNIEIQLYVPAPSTNIFSTSRTIYIYG